MGGLGVSKPRIKISFSGGRTSAVMTKLSVEKYSSTHDILVVFANTGCERPETLEFVNKCDTHFGWDVHWVEAVINPEHGKGSRGKRVTHETASRNGEPFEAAVAKYGVFGPSYPNCTGRLKTEILHSYVKQNFGWNRGTYDTFIGIRSDEVDRISPSAKKNRLRYPLIEWGWNKDMVLAECRRWPFDLKLKGEHYGNCVWCWKKSFRKLATLAKEDPSVFDFPARMEAKYGTHKAKNESGVRTFFRGNKSTKDILAMASDPHLIPYADSSQTTMWDAWLDTGSSCGESCEIGADEQ